MLQVGSGVIRGSDAPFHHLPAFRGLVTKALSLHRGRLRFRSFLPPTHPATVQRPPNISRSMFRCSGSSHRAESSRYPRRARSTPGSRFALCLSWIVLAYPVRGLRSFVAAAALEKVFGRQARPGEGGEPCPPPKVGDRYAHCRLARDRSREWRLRNGERLGNEKSLPSSRGKILQAQPTQARIVSVCRRSRKVAGRAESSAQIGRCLRPARGRLPLLGDGGARLRWQRARQPTNAAANSPRSTRRCRFDDRGASHGINRRRLAPHQLLSSA